MYKNLEKKRLKNEEAQKSKEKEGSSFETQILGQNLSLEANCVINSVFPPYIVFIFIDLIEYKFKTLFSHHKFYMVFTNFVYKISIKCF